MKKFFIVSLLIHLLLILPACYFTVSTKEKAKPVYMQVSMVQGECTQKNNSVAKAGQKVLEHKTKLIKEIVEKNNVSKKENIVVKKTEMFSKQKKIKEEITPKQSDAKKSLKENNDAKGENTKVNQGAGGKNKNGTALDIFAGGKFTKDATGVYTAASCDGIDYKILFQEEPRYPKEAKSINYSKRVVVQAHFIVDLSGKVRDIKVVNKVPKLGFYEETIKVLNKMRFEPIKYKGHLIKCRFAKEFYFYPS